MQNHICCICSIFLHCANVSSNCLPDKMQIHIGYICMIFLHCAFSHVSSYCLSEKMQIHIEKFINHWRQKRKGGTVRPHWLHLFDFYALCAFKCFLRLPASMDAKSHWLHLYDFSPLCLFKCVFKSRQRNVTVKKFPLTWKNFPLPPVAAVMTNIRYSRIGCIYVTLYGRAAKKGPF